MIYKIFKISLTILFFNILISQSQFSGNANFSYANRLNDGSLLKLPYRMFELKYANESENFSLNSELAFEWNRKMDTDFLTDNNPQDFILDILNEGQKKAKIEAKKTLDQAKEKIGYI